MHGIRNGEVTAYWFSIYAVLNGFFIPCVDIDHLACLKMASNWASRMSRAMTLSVLVSGLTVSALSVGVGLVGAPVGALTLCLHPCWHP